MEKRNLECSVGKEKKKLQIKDFYIFSGQNKGNTAYLYYGSN